jgi:hypothetical protein
VRKKYSAVKDAQAVCDIDISAGKWRFRTMYFLSQRERWINYVKWPPNSPELTPRFKEKPK